MADLVIKLIETGEEVDRIFLTDTSESHVERVMSGLLINMDTDKFFIDDSEVSGDDDGE